MDTGGWLSGRRVLILPVSVRDINWNDEVLNVDLSRQQVRESPSIDTDKPVSRQHEIDYNGYPNYWEGANLWELSACPMPWVGATGDVQPSPQPADLAHARERSARTDQERQAADSHLRSGSEVIGYEIMATDGPVGNAENLVFDQKSRAIRYLVVDTRKSPGKHVLLSPEWIGSVSWPGHQVYVQVERRAVETSPEYDPSHTLTREYEGHSIGTIGTPCTGVRCAVGLRRRIPESNTRPGKRVSAHPA